MYKTELEELKKELEATEETLSTLSPDHNPKFEKAARERQPGWFADKVDEQQQD